MARNLIDLVDDFDDDKEVDLFEKLGHSNKRKFNKRNDLQEKIKQQRRERQKIRQQAVMEDKERI